MAKWMHFALTILVALTESATVLHQSEHVHHER